MTTAARPLRIGILEDQQLFREMLQHLLQSVPGMQVRTAMSLAQTQHLSEER